MKHNKLKFLTMRFSDGGGDPNPAPADPKPADPAPMNFDDLIKSNKDFQSWVDSKIGTATATAISKAQQKWQKLHDDRLSEAERLQAMTAEEKASYFEKKWKDAEETRTRSENARQLEKQTLTMFAESKIPAELISTIDFNTATAESVKSRIELLSKFEFYPVGTFEQKVTEQMNEKLKQKPPESHNTNSSGADYSKLLAEAQASNNAARIAYYTRKIAEEKQQK